MNSNETVANRERYILTPVCDRQAVTEVTGDFTLPDYQSEIRRILNVGYSVLPPARYVGAGSVEFNGNIEYQVLYVGVDGGLYTAPLTSEYAFDIPFEGSVVELNEGITVFAHPSVQGITSRVSAPRRLSIRTRLACRARAYGKVPLEERPEGGEDPFCIQRKSESVEMASLGSAASEIITLEEELPFSADGDRVVGAEAKVFVDGVSANGGVLTAQGNVMLKLLCAHENSGDTELIQRKLPFSGELEGEEREAGDTECRVTGYISDLTVHPEEDKLLCTVNLILEAQTGSNGTLTYTDDLYSTSRECRCERAEYEIPVLLAAGNGNFTQSERIPLAELNLPEGCTPVDCTGYAEFDGVEAQGNKCVLTGQSRYVVIARRDGEYSAAECVLPIRYEVDCEPAEKMTSDSAANVVSCRVRCEGEQLLLDSEIGVASMLLASRKIYPVQGAEFGENISHPKGDMVICYPQSGESNWSVAKRYRVAPSAIDGNVQQDPYVLIRE